MEKEVYVFGHRNPDTDSVTAAISLAHLKKQLGINAIPTVLSDINLETKYALNYFNVNCDINAGQTIEIVAHWTLLLPQIASPCQNKSSISSTQ